MNFLRRCIAAYVAAYAAWKMFPRTVTVIPNDVLADEMCDPRFNMKDLDSTP